MGAESFQHGFGVGVNVLSALESLRSPGGLGRYLQGETLAREDPNVRASLVGSPFSAGLLGVSGSRQPLSLGPGGTGPSAPQQVWQPNLPPLSPEAQVRQQLAGIEATTLGNLTPEQQQQAASYQLGIPLAPGAVPQGFEPYQIGPSGTTYRRAAPQTPDFVPVEGAPGLFYSPGLRRTATAPKPVGAEARARAEATADEQAKVLGFSGARDPAYIAFIRRTAGIGQPGGAPTPAGGAPTPETPTPPGAAAPSPAPEIPGNTPIGALPFADEGGVGYPSPAFDDQTAMVQTPRGPMNALATNAELGFTPPRGAMLPPASPATTQVAQAQPTGGGLPPGMTLRAGPLTLRGSAPAPAAGKAVPAATSSRLAGEASASQAARQALAMLQQGPQAPFTIGGYPVGTPPHFAGPVSGRALGALTSVSGQPLAVEQAQLAALVAHAKTGVFGITGLRPNEKTLAMFDPLMPNLNQPTEILRAHLERLSGFYDMLTQMQGVLSNLSEDQKRALVYDLFRQHMTAPGPNGVPPPVIDVRQPGVQ